MRKEFYPQHFLGLRSLPQEQGWLFKGTGRIFFAYFYEGDGLSQEASLGRKFQRRFTLVGFRKDVNFPLMRSIRNKWTSVGVSLIAGAGAAMGAEALHVYSHRHYEVDQKVNALFTEKTGIEVKVVNAEADQLIERLKSEGKDSPADVLITVDAARMQRAVEDGLLFSGQVLHRNILQVMRREPFYFRVRCFIATFYK